MLSRKKQISHKILKNKTKTKKKQYILNGGKYLDKGGFGCVVKPAIPCKVFKPKNFNYNNYVSKIINNPDIGDINEEIRISHILTQIDPQNTYFITINDYCYIPEPELLKDRTDIIAVEYLDKKKTKYDISSKPNLDKKHCIIDINEKSINLIFEYGGISLSKIMKINRKDTNNIKAKIHQLFITNINLYFKHLLIGLEKMHRNKIVNRDIKQKNIMLYIDQSKLPQLASIDLTKKNDNILNIMKLRYIDFGLATHITTSVSTDIKNIFLCGTYRYVAPEIFISYVLVQYKNRSTQYKHKKINEKLKNLKEALDRLEEKHMIQTLKENINSLYLKIQYLCDNNKILDKYFGSNSHSHYNGYLQKADVYALGITIFDTLHIKKYSNVNVRKNKNLYDLLLNMIKIDPDERFNVIQCIHHPYFTESST